jgi:subfamily B ATP-binding cassette protein MsbA
MGDTGTLGSILTSASVVVFKDPVTLISLATYLLWKQPKLTLLSMVVMPLCMIPVVVYGRKVRRASREVQTFSAELSSIMSEAFTGSRVIKAYNLEGAVVQQFRTATQKFIGHSMRAVRSGELPGPLLEAVAALGVSLVLIYLCVQKGSRPDSADFVAFVLAIISMYRPLKNMTRLYSSFVQARAATERVFELLATPNSILEPHQPVPLHAAGATIQFDKVSFAYDEKPILKDISLHAQPGQLIALVGRTGSGKTTLTSLLLRFYDPSNGSIRIGSTDLREVASRELRNQIAVVTQETVLFNQTIRQNILLGRPGASDQDIIEAARHAHALEFINEKPNGFNTIIGEKGITLSGGQRQRIAIARALLKNAPILILDEATSALDTEAERAVQAALEELMVGRTTFCIAHRLSTIQKADLIVVLDQGRIVETGTHAELVEKGGIYQKLYQLQFQTTADE